MNKRALGCLALAGWLVGSACGDNPAIAIIPVRIELTPPNNTVYVGQVGSLTARVFNTRDEEIPDPSLTWSGDAPLVALVDSLTGNIAGIAPGVTRVTVRAGSVSDTATVFVLDVLQITLPYDTLFLAPQDTFTIPVEVAVAPGTPAPTIGFGGGAPGIATVNPATGLVTAIGSGSAAYVVQADTVTAAGLISVVVLTDTLSGIAHVGLSGAVAASVTLSARSFNHPTDDSRTVFQIHAEGGVHDLSVVLIDSLTGPGTRVPQTIPPNGLGGDPVCRPPGSFVFYRHTLSPLTALSVAGGAVTVTSDRPLQGQRAISGRMDVTLQQTNLPGPEGRIRVRATLVTPLLTLPTCPK